MKLLVLLFLLGFCTPLAAQVEQPINITTADSGLAQIAPRIAARGDLRYVAYIQSSKASSGDIFFRHWISDDSLTPAIQVTTTGKINGSLQLGPEFVITPDSVIHLVWVEARVGGNYDIFYSRGTENGTMWSAPLDISRDEQKASQDYPSIAADSAGNLYVIWIDTREIVQGKSLNDHVFITRSMDGGNTWDDPKRADMNPSGKGGSCECCRTAIAASPEGEIYFAFRTNIDHERDIFIARSMDRGATFDTTIRVQTKPWPVHGCPSTGPMIALDKRKNLHVVYRSAANANRAVVFYNLLPYGSDRTFNEIPLTELTGSNANYPDIAVSSEGAITVAYQRSGRIVERHSLDGGNSWSPESRLDPTESAQMLPFLEFDDMTGELLTLWQDDRRDRNDVMFYSRELSGAVTLPQFTNCGLELRGDSIDVYWNSSTRAATWTVVQSLAGEMVVLDTVVTLHAAVLDHHPVHITLMSANGSVGPCIIEPMSVRANDTRKQLIPSKNPVRVGDVVSIVLDASVSAKWFIADMLGRRLSEIASTSTERRTSFVIPEVPSGAYYIVDDAMTKVTKIVVE